MAWYHATRLALGCTDMKGIAIVTCDNFNYDLRGFLRDLTDQIYIGPLLKHATIV